MEHQGRDLKSEDAETKYEDEVESSSTAGHPEQVEIASVQRPRTPKGEDDEPNGLSDRIETDEADGESEDPGEEIEPYDWDDLYRRFSEMVAEREEEEGKLMNEFVQLCGFFQQWANTTTVHEVERASKRLRTRVYHVQNSESELEAKRQHYLNVVQAFQSALSLLNG